MTSIRVVTTLALLVALTTGSMAHFDHDHFRPEIPSSTGGKNQATSSPGDAGHSKSAAESAAETVPAEGDGVSMPGSGDQPKADGATPETAAGTDVDGPSPTSVEGSPASAADPLVSSAEQGPGEGRADAAAPDSSVTSTDAGNGPSPAGTSGSSPVTEAVGEMGSKPSETEVTELQGSQQPPSESQPVQPINTPAPGAADPAAPQSTKAPSGTEPSSEEPPKDETEETPEETPEISPEETPEQSPGDLASPEPSEEEEDEDDGSACFPADATVELEDGSIKRMDDLSVGDSVRTGPRSFSKIFMFTHRDSAICSNFLTFTTSSGASLTLTRGHYLYADGALKASEEVRLGSVLTIASGAQEEVVSIAKSRGSGLFNPQTLSGDIIVNGVLASTYTTAVAPGVAHGLLAPFRLAYSTLGLYTSTFDFGSPRLADVAPTGASIV